MPLSQNDTARLYSDSFATNMKALAGENAFVIADLKTQLDVSKMAQGVLQDELDAANKSIDALRAKWMQTAEYKAESDANHQALVDSEQPD